MIEKINESIKINKYKKLKDSIHDIVTKLNNNQWLDMIQLSKELKSFNIVIQPIVLKKMLNDWINNNSRIFDNDDYEWLYYDKDSDIVFNTLGFEKKKNLGKYRRKQIKEYNKKLKTELEKKKKDIIENVNKIEKNKKLTCPIPTEIFLDLFNDIDENDIIQLKKSINDEIKNKKLKNLYEPTWDFIIDISTKSIGEGGYGYELKDKEEWDKHKPKEDWVIPDEKDIDKYIPVWYFKYGIGKITSYDGYQMSIEFDGSYIPKNFNAISLLNNKTIRINKEYIKKPSDIDGYKPARLIDLSYGSNILHKDRGEGTIYSIGEYNIKMNIDNKSIKIPTNLFHIYQKILEPVEIYNKKNEERKNNIVNELKIKNKKEISDNEYIKITNKNDIKEGDTVYIYSTKIKRKISSINNDMVNFDNFNYSSDIDNLIKYGVYKKVSDINNNDDDKFIIVNNINELKPGDIVKHKKFGIGVILEIDNFFINVDFNNINRFISKTYTIDNKLLSKKEEKIKPFDEYTEYWIPVENINELEKGMVVKYINRKYKVDKIDGDYININSINHSSKIGMPFRKNMIYKKNNDNKKETINKNTEKDYVNVDNHQFPRPQWIKGTQDNILIEVGNWYKSTSNYKELIDDDYYELVEIRKYNHNIFKYVIIVYKSGKKLKKIFNSSFFLQKFDVNDSKTKNQIENENSTKNEIKNREITFNDGTTWTSEELNEYIENTINVDEYDFKDKITTPSIKNFFVYLVKNSLLYQKEFYELLKKIENTIIRVKRYKYDSDYLIPLNDLYNKIKNNNKFFDS